MHSKKEKLAAFGKLLDIMDDLREKCPWDQKQTMESLSYLTVEETYELTDAISEGNLEEVKKEIGDLMLHMVFYSKIGSEKQAFDIADVLNGICEKLIYRHPHIYGDVTVSSEAEVKANWEALKLKEGKKSVLEGVPKSLPALVKAIRIQEKAKGVGFDWDKPEDVWSKVREELQEFEQAMQNQNTEEAENEFGDLLFSLINFARFKNIHPETALEKTNKKFIKRFQYIEKKANSQNKNIQDLTLAEMDVFWNEAKRQ
ncbi:MAG: nucleoside triphosphate pyrophosphohydrolase [Schleiferiaceae bacterium]|nr:nucleoside triphosphate pyrophosphohydrolase [Schleiferiaceae bacterium]